MDVDIEKLKSHFSKMSPQMCNMCGHTSWEVNPKIFYLPEFHKNGVVVGGPSFPVIPITCANCGNTIFINAIIAGVMDSETEEKKNEHSNI